MNTHPQPAEHRRIPHTDLVVLIHTALVDAGVPAALAAVEAELMAEADLLGTPSHGIRMLPRQLEAIRLGKVKATPQIAIRSEFAAVCSIDGDYGPGRYVSLTAMNQAVDRARRFGIGACLATRASHWGRAHAYAVRAAQAGMIGICMTNAMSGMLAAGSDTIKLGNNPLAIGVPRGPGADPVVLDIAMSQAAIGKIVTYLRSGKKAPIGWGLDKNGQPTDDPAAILESRRVLPMGEHKGSGLSLMIEMMTAALAGGLLCNEMAASDQGGMDIDSSKLFLALDPGAFGDRSVFLARVEDLLAYLQSAPAGSSPVLFPGQNGWATRDRHRVEGIPIEPATLAELAKAGIQLPSGAGQPNAPRGRS